MEIKAAAKKFREYWNSRSGYEKGEDQQFWNSLLRDVLGAEDIESSIKYQVPVKLKNTTKFLDAWIPETRVLIEHKSRGVNLDAPQAGHGGMTPYEQAKEYDDARGFDEKARWIVLCNFDEFLIYDCAKPLDKPERITLNELPKEVHRLSFLVDKKVSKVDSKELEISVQAGRIVAKLYDALLKQFGSNTPETLAALNRLCVRLVFCLYAEDADIFPKNALRNLVKSTPVEFLRRQLLRLFQTLDTPVEKRDRYLEAELAVFPYTNGGLFAGASESEIPPLTEEISRLLDGSSNFDWSGISPTIFGALFESTLNPDTRRASGMVYTSVKNIHKVIDPLFMNDLTAELESIKSERAIAVRRAKAAAFQEKLGSLTFLDPACGSGNFLTETFLSLRKLENEAIVVGERLKPGEVLLNLDGIVKVSIKQFHGIEINDFAVSVAKTALWISEAKMLNETAKILHAPPKFLPLHDYDGIVEGNALRMDWGNLISRGGAETRSFDYIMGNPPFVGTNYLSDAQREDMDLVWGGDERGKLDFVSCWYVKASVLAEKSQIRCAFVSTNSVVQGEQATSLWKRVFAHGMKIDFAHRTFRWDNESFEKAHVHCVIVGFSSLSVRSRQKTIFDEAGTAHIANNINQYLLDAPSLLVEESSRPLCDVPSIVRGSQATDDGLYLFTEEERDDFLRSDPEAACYFKRFMMWREFINNIPRFCLWIPDISPRELREHSGIYDRVQKVRAFRAASKNTQTRQAADCPTRFGQYRPPAKQYIAFAKVSSQHRRYIPFGFLTDDVIPGDKLFTIPNATLYHFGVLTSSVHMAWMRAVCGRLKSDYSYSTTIVYNNFPWPSSALSASLRQKIETTGQGILDARAKHAGSSLADLYDEVAMPLDLRAAHAANDRAVLVAYGLKPDTPEPEIVAHLFKLYAEMTKKEGD